jgi:hypothetical protein
LKEEGVTMVYYDLGLFKDIRDVEEFLKDSFSFLISREYDVYIKIGKDYNKFVTCSYVWWYEFVTFDTLCKYYTRAYEIYFPDFEDKEVARSYYENYLGSLGIGDLNSLIEKDESKAVFLLMYLLMLKDDVVLKSKTV